MSKLGIAITITIASGIVVGGLVLDKQKQESPSVKSSIHMVVMPGECPTRPVQPRRVVCWTELGMSREYRDCTDNSRMGKCEADVDEPWAIDSSDPCPMCMPDCETVLLTDYATAHDEYTEARQRCPDGMRTAGDYCTCYTNADTDPDGAIDVPSIPNDAKHVLFICGVRDDVGHGSHAVTSWGRAIDGPPAGCVRVGRAVFDPRSTPGVETDFDRAMRDACAPYPVYPADHGHCPACVVWPDGCPPCRSIADKYGRGWIGHEDECDQ